VGCEGEEARGEAEAYAAVGAGDEDGCGGGHCKFFAGSVLGPGRCVWTLYQAVRVTIYQHLQYFTLVLGLCCVTKRSLHYKA
jgi:hypothetical protein